MHTSLNENLDYSYFVQPNDKFRWIPPFKNVVAERSGVEIFLDDVFYRFHIPEKLIAKWEAWLSKHAVAPPYEIVGENTLRFGDETLSIPFRLIAPFSELLLNENVYS